MNHRQVVVTGTGLTTPLGCNTEKNWAAIKSKKTGISHHPAADLPEFLQYAGKVLDYELPGDIPPKQRGQMKFLNRGAMLGFSATYEAIRDSREFIHTIQPGRRALYVSSGDFTKVGFDFMYPAIKDAVDEHWSRVNHETLNESALNKVNPFFLLESLHNNLFSFLSAYVEFMGPNTSLSSLSPCGSNALELACRSIMHDKADIALAVGYGNWITEIPVYELEGLGILSQCKSGAASFRPFDRQRDGFIPGEGGAAILLEEAESARKRGSKILAIVRGFENSLESALNDNMTVPPLVSKQNIITALKNSRCSIDEIAFLISHGSGTRKGDMSEMSSIMDLPDEAGLQVPVCGLKPYTGHMGAASDIAEVIMGIWAVRDKLVPATLNFSETEREFSKLRISGDHQECRYNKFISFSYGIGGQASSVVIEVN